MKRKFLNLIMLTATAMGVLSARADNAIRITDPLGETVVIKLESRPTVYYAEESVVFVSEDSSVTFSIDDTLKVEFIDTEEDGIKSVEIDDAVVNINQNEICVTNLRPESKISVYDLSGLLMGVAVANAEGTASMDISGWQRGFYILSAKGFSIKFKF